MIDNYYKNTPNIQTKNNNKVRSLTLSQILESKSVTFNSHDEVLNNIQIAMRNKQIISLEDLLPRYKKELAVIDTLNKQLENARGESQINPIRSKIQKIKFSGL